MVNGFGSGFFAFALPNGASAASEVRQGESVAPATPPSCVQRTNLVTAKVYFEATIDGGRSQANVIASKRLADHVTLSSNRYLTLTCYFANYVVWTVFDGGQT